jgi:hypothetical protein
MRPLDTGLDEPGGQVADVQPRAMRPVEIDHRVRLRLDPVDRVVELGEPLDIGEWEARAAVRVQQAERVGFEDDDRVALADAFREGIDPGFVLGCRQRSTSRQVRAVTAGDVVGDEDRHCALGALERGMDGFLDLFRRSLREPDGLRGPDHLLDELRVGFVTASAEVLDLGTRSRVGFGDVEPGVMILGSRDRGRGRGPESRERDQPDDDHRPEPVSGRSWHRSFLLMWLPHTVS